MDPELKGEVRVRDKGWGSLAFGGEESLVVSVVKRSSAKTESWGDDRGHSSELVEAPKETQTGQRARKRIMEAKRGLCFKELARKGHLSLLWRSGDV